MAGLTPVSGLTRGGRNALFQVAELFHTVKDKGFTSLGERWGSEVGLRRFGKDIASIGALAAAGIIGYKAVSGINVAGESAIDSAASAAGNLVGYRMTYGALSMIPGLK